MKIKVIYRHCEPTPESERAEQIVARGIRRIIFEEIEKIERRELKEKSKNKPGV